MPVNLTFASKAYDDSSLLRYAYAFEKHSQLRQKPSRAPDLPTDRIALSSEPRMIGSAPPRLTVDNITEIKAANGRGFYLSGSVYENELTALRVYLMVTSRVVSSWLGLNGRWISSSLPNGKVEWGREARQTKGKQ
jgi:hypothetical protein